MATQVLEQTRRELGLTMRQAVLHELNTPLASLLAALELLSYETLTPDAAELVGVARRNGTRLRAAVAELTDAPVGLDPFAGQASSR